MRTRTCFLLALAVVGLGLAVRLALPVAPVDAAYRAVVLAYATMAAPAP